MRPDKQKLRAQQKSGAKDQKKDLDDRAQPRAASRPANDASDENALAKVRHREQKGPTIH